MISILFAHFGDDWIRGSERLLLDLVANLDRSRFRPVVWCNGREMFELCSESGITAVRSDFTHFFDANSPEFDRRHFVGIVREGLVLARKHDVAVIHANSAAPTQFLVPVARILRLPLISHWHIDYLRRARYALLTHQAECIVGVSRQVLEDPLRDGVPAARTRVIYNGIDFARLDALPGVDLRPALGIPADAVVVGALGSLISRKGHDVLVRAFAQLPPAAEPLHLIIGGDGPERRNLQTVAAEAGVADRVHILGYYKSVTDIYRTADVMALASRAEAFGLVLAEAGYMGRPVVATRVGGVPEVVLNHKSGFLVEPDDVEALAAALGLLTTNPALRETMGREGRRRVQSMFSVQRMASEFESLYDQLAAQPRRQFGWSSMAGRLRPYARLVTNALAA